MRIDRRETIKLASIMLAGLGAAGTPAQETGAPLASGTASKQDFDYFIGDWRVEHHRLRQRLAGSRDWEVFAGHTRCQKMFDGLVNLNESVAYRQGRKTYGLGLRAFDAPRGRWVDWYLSAGDLSRIDAPLYGRFADRVGTFYSRDIFEGRPILVRGRFMPVNDAEAKWDQAFSIDEGVTWEINWIMRYLRSA